MLGLACALAACAALANEAQPLAADPQLEARVQSIAAELRCLVCQNETLAASQSALAVDLRAQISQQLAQGRSSEQIKDYMVERYGDFVLYRPAFNARTALLWLGPFALFAGALFALVRIVRRHARGPEAS
ncbi:cytochrome c-type biogenesis protein [Xylophilus sp. ASV27]|uniref:cytochrome c-type biogenesis protein n=1 Tax=Xylophilus sp. ASV27 TaxID=2795129 RepID=UPI001E2F2E87|nr:cytochrome c-type biogenesis protein [Xylophilus sp. ASV27]